MAFVCQKDSYLREFKTRVTSCKPAELEIERRKIRGFEVTFEDTVLFPEGGGQNDDRGLVDSYPVWRVTRRGPNEAVHFVEAEVPFDIGQEVTQKLNWTRRFDHMQQHSGQHLISAFFLKKLEVPTTSWWMADDSDEDRVGISYVELESQGIFAQEAIRDIEEECNEAIRRQEKVKVDVYQPGDPELESTRSRGLPDDVQVPVRVVRMVDDSNMCCGTHVNNLAHLQVVKLLNAEKSKKKGRVNLNFIVGGRVNKYLDRCFARERRLTEILQNGPSAHEQLVEKLVKTSKNSQKLIQNLLRQTAIREAQSLKAMDSKPKFYSCYKKEASSDFAGVFIGELGEENDILLFIVTGEDPCQMTLSGNPKDVQALGPKIISLLEGKGGGKGRRINAKFNSPKKIPEAVRLIEEYFSSGDVEK